MQTIRATINLEIDGQQVDGYPFIKQLTVDESQGFHIERVTGGGFIALPLDQLSNVQFLIVRSDKEVTLRLDGQSDAGIVIAANGILFIAGATIDTPSLATVDNSSGDTVIVRGVGAGT